ncbi:muscleblind-like protein 2a isoform X5 [Bolinopsis microptera]|uniref:muscleblind-like protein 2a isoform X5 n=1 Tax=Bolinopsis microptera TaxID=2820187 RepID=UPI00307A2BC7
MLNVSALQGNTRDRRWLMIEVCREFQRGKCSREADECRYAHPPAHVSIENGHVTACFDSLKDQCTRDSCKYLHPPKLVKEELQASSRAFSQTQTALQQLCNPLMLQQQAMCATQNMISPWGFMVPQVMPLSFTPTAVVIPEVPCSGGRRKDKSDKLEVCREYQRSQCPRGNDECKYAHPEPHIHPDPNDNMVTVCMDFMKERCERESCRYYHPPPHLQARVKANQLNASSLMAAAAQSQALALGPGGTGNQLSYTTPASSAALLPTSSTCTTPSMAFSSYQSSPLSAALPSQYYHAQQAAALAPNPALQPTLNPMYALSGLNGLSGGAHGLAGAGLGQAFSGAGLMGGAGLMSMAGAGNPGAGLYDPATLSAMGALALPKDPIARSTMLAQMAAEKAVLTSRKRKLMDTMSGYPEMVKRQALGVAGAGQASLMSPWNMSQQLALQGALAGQGAMTAQPQLLTSSALMNPTAAALMHQQAALGYTTYALPASSSPYSIPAQYPSAQQTVAQTPTATPTQ